MPDTPPLTISRLGLPPDTLAGQVAVVTGAGRGIGLETARALTWLGAAVVIAEIGDSGRAAEETLRAAGRTALFVQTDVSSEDSVAHLQRVTSEQFGPAGILVNNAILCPTGAVLEMDVALWDRVMAVNLRGTFLTCRAFLPGMLARKAGTIVNMISRDALPYLSAYIASKQGILAFTQSLAGEVGGQGVRAVALAPGFVPTPGLRGAAEGLAPHMGITAEEFLQLPFHPAYPAGMPAADAGAATAYLVAKLAGEYHGESVTGYTILERAGFLPAGSTPLAAALPSAAPALAGDDTGVDETLALARRLQAVLADTDATFNKLPIFIRPMARQGFKSKSGQSLQDWARTAARLVTQLQDVEHGAPAALAALCAERVQLKELLAKLSMYYAEEPAEMARFTKDAEVLRQAQIIADERTGTIRALVAGLDALQG